MLHKPNVSLKQGGSSHVYFVNGDIEGGLFMLVDPYTNKQIVSPFVQQSSGIIYRQRL